MSGALRLIPPRLFFLALPTLCAFVKYGEKPEDAQENAKHQRSKQKWGGLI
jgi:hypothetical protein